MPLLDPLNERQREAVTHTEGPMLVLAGAGTGKTRVITYRAAYLLEKGVAPHSILCVTFTNKAAEQMKNRIGDLLRSTGHDASQLWISTFHSFAARLLRREAPRLGLPRDFAIYDDDAQTGAVKLALQQLGLSDRDYPRRTKWPPKPPTLQSATPQPSSKPTKPSCIAPALSISTICF